MCKVLLWFFSIGFSLVKVLLSFPVVLKKFAQSCSNSVWLDCAGSPTLKSFTAINSTQLWRQPRRFWILPSLLPISNSTGGKILELPGYSLLKGCSSISRAAECLTLTAAAEKMEHNQKDRTWHTESNQIQWWFKLVLENQGAYTVIWLSKIYHSNFSEFSVENKLNKTISENCASI